MLEGLERSFVKMDQVSMHILYYIHQWRNWNGRTTWTKRQGYFGIMEIIENLVEN